MENKGKKLNIVFITIISILSITIIILSITLGIVANKSDKLEWGNTNGNTITIDDYTQVTYEDGIKTNAERVANSDNASLFFLSRRGAFIATQYISDITMQKDINKDKEVYMVFSNTTHPDGDISGWDQWPSIMDWDALNINGTYHKDVGTTSFSINEKDLDKIYNEFDFSTNKKIDIYLDSYTYATSDKEMKKNFVQDIGSYWDNINSITFYADGTAIYTLEDEYKEVLNTYNTEDIELANTTLELLTSGLITTDNVGDNELETMSMLLPILTPNDSDDYIQVFSPSYDVYTTGPRENILQASGTGFEQVVTSISNESLNSMKEVVSLDEYEETEQFKDQEGKTNFVFSGNLVESTEQAESDGDKIKQIIDNFTDSTFNEDNFRLLYKPHPRSDSEDLDYMVEYVSTITGTDASVWLQIIPKSIPFEFFAMTGEFNDNPATSTDYQLFLTATSTVVPALYECGITSDNVEAYFGNEGDEERLRAWYGDSGIIDYSKLILS